MIYSYQRVSSKEQNLARQEEAFEKWCNENGINLKDCLIFADKQSGKDFERKNYQLMLEELKQGDVLVIKSIDRLGRNYDLIIAEWTKITKSIKADIVVIDMPLLDTRDKKENLTGKFISDIVLQLLSYVAETERNNIKQRQREGIDIALQNGVKFGAKEKITNQEEIDNFKTDYISGMKYIDIQNKYNLTKPTIINMAKKLGLPSRNKTAKAI